MIASLLLVLFYPVAIQYKRGGAWYLLLPLVVLVLLLDVVANYTEWAIVFGFPKNAHTVSQRLKQMLNDEVISRRVFAYNVQAFLDACEPDGKH